MTAKKPFEDGKLARVLVATDGTDDSAGAIRLGVALAKTYAAELVGLTVEVENPEFNTLVPNLQEAVEQHAQEALKSFVEETGGNARTVIREASDSAHGIADAAGELAADIIVMGQHAKGGISRLLFSDTAAKVVGHADCPVLVAPRAAWLWGKRILLATDGSERGEAAEPVAAHLAARFRLPITVVTVITNSNSEEERAEAQKVVADTVSRLASQGMEVEGKVEEGAPGESVVKAAESVAADLIVVGSHGRTGLSKVLLGSVAEKIISDASCPVLIIKS